MEQVPFLLQVHSVDPSNSGPGSTTGGAKRGKVPLPHQMADSLTHGCQIERTPHVPGIVPDKGRAPSTPVNGVTIVLPDGIEARIETVRCLPGILDGDIGRKKRIEPVGKSTQRQPLVGGKGGDHTPRMDPGIVRPEECTRTGPFSIVARASSTTC